MPTDTALNTGIAQYCDTALCTATAQCTATALHTDTALYHVQGTWCTIAAPDTDRALYTDPALCTDSTTYYVPILNTRADTALLILHSYCY